MPNFTVIKLSGTTKPKHNRDVNNATFCRYKSRGNDLVQKQAQLISMHIAPLGILDDGREIKGLVVIRQMEALHRNCITSNMFQGM